MAQTKSNASTPWSPARMTRMAIWTVSIIISVATFASAFPGWWSKSFSGQSPYETRWVGNSLEVTAEEFPDRILGEQALAPGQQVLAIDGIELAPDMGRPALEALTYGAPGSIHTWSFADESGQHREVDLTYDHSALAQQIEAQGVASGHVLVGASTIFTRLVRTLAFLGAATALGLVGGPNTMTMAISAGLAAYGLGTGLDNGFHPEWLWFWLEFARLVTIVTVAYGCLVLPTGTYSSRWAKALSATWILVGIVVLKPIFLPWDGLLNSHLNLPIQLTFLLLGAGTMFYRYLKQSTPLEQAQMRWVTYGFALGVLSMAAHGLHLFGYGAAHNFHLAVTHPLIMCMVPSAIMVAVFRYRVWDLGDVSRHSMVWVLLASSVVVGTAILTEVIGEVLVAALPQLEQAEVQIRFGMVVLALLAAGGFTFLARPWIERAADEVLFPHRLLVQNALAEGREALGDCQTLSEVTWCTTAILRRGWRVHGVELWLIEADGHWSSASQSGASPPRVHGSKAVKLAAGRWTSLPNPKTDDGTPRMALVPVSRGGVLLAVVMVEPSTSQGGLSTHDRRMMQRLTEPLWQAIERTLPTNHRLALHSPQETP